MKLGRCIKTEILAKLAMYQWEQYHIKLDIVTEVEEKAAASYDPRLEFKGIDDPPDELEKLMKRRPRHPRKVA